MTPAQPNDYDIFCSVKVFDGLNEHALKRLYAASQKIELKKGEILIREGGEADALYIILEGALDVIKCDAEHREECSIDLLKAGDTVGELSFIDKGSRSASVVARTNAQIRSISFNTLEEMAKESPALAEIYLVLSKSLSHKLRNTNTVVIESLKLRLKMGYFFVNTVVLLCLFTAALSWLQNLTGMTSEVSYIVLLVTLVFGAAVLMLMKLSKCSWQYFGITWINGKRALFEGVVFTLPILVGILCTKWAWVHFSPALAGAKLFDPFATIREPQDHTWLYWTSLNLMYSFLTIPIHELVIRGGVQGLLEQFLAGKHKALLANVVSNVIYATLHLFLGIEFSLLVFCMGLYLGWLYSRTHTLLSSWTAHVLIGLFAISILGIPLYNPGR